MTRLVELEVEQIDAEFRDLLPWDAEDRLHNYVNNYNETYKYIKSTYVSLNKFYEIIKALEDRLRISNEARFKPQFPKTEFKFKSLHFGEVFCRYEDDRLGLTAMKQLCQNINYFEDRIFAYRLEVCKYLHHLGEETKVPLSNWGEINAFLDKLHSKNSCS